MKNFKIIAPVLAVILLMSSCIIDRRHDDVRACFAVDQGPHYVREYVYFTNCSQDAYDYFWDFGDGYSSTLEHPSHIYDEPGTYQVRLTAYGKYDDYETYTQNVDVEGSTDLDILVLIEGIGLIAADCDVYIYGTFTDWQDDTNLIVSGTTDNEGIVLFQGLDPIVYYAWCELVGDGVTYNNVDLGNATEALVQDEINYYTFYIQEDLTKKGNKSTSVISKVEKTTKAERENLLKELGLK